MSEKEHGDLLAAVSLLAVKRLSVIAGGCAAVACGLAAALFWQSRRKEGG